MSDFNTILIIGATSGLGRELARRYHARGKKIIATGRRIERLRELKRELPGIETAEMDVLDIESFAAQLTALTKSHPALDTVFLMSGVMEHYFFANPSISLSQAVNEVTTNLAAPVALAHTLVPIFVNRSHPTNIVLVTSGLAYRTLPVYPTYCGTKAAVHYLCVNLRSQLAGTNVNIIELNPPYVDTELDAKFRDDLAKAQGENAMAPMPLAKYIDATMKGLDERDAEGKPKKEVSLEFSEEGAGMWRKTFQPWLDMLGLKG